jgi:predicted AlkP superfamily pyrophosphatase or phosphodiesterase
MTSVMRSTRIVLPALPAIFFLLASFGCARPHYVRGLQPTSVAPKPEADRVHKNVILISVDGLRPDAINTFKAETLARLMRDGSYTLTASTILPSKTLPSHTSMLTGEPPDTHGVLWNNKRMFASGGPESPTIFGVLRATGLKTAAFFSKSKFEDLQTPGSLDYSQAPGGLMGGLIPGRWSSDRTAEDAARYLKSARPNLLFVHFGDADTAGHRSGWMAAAYGDAVRRVDASIARLLSAADEAYGPANYTVIVTADHGGHGRDHGSDNPLDVTIPWIAWGNGINPGRITEKVKTMDTASTVLWLFGVDEPTEWAGTPVTGAFHASND